MIRRCATSIEAEGIQRPHANTSQVIFFFFFLFFFKTLLFFFFVVFFLSFSTLPLIQVTLKSRGATARVRSRAWILMVVRRADLRTLSVQSKETWPQPGPGDLTMQEPSFFFHGWGFFSAAARNHSRQTDFGKKSCSFFFLFCFCLLEGVGVSAHPATQSELLPRWWMNHVQWALGALQLLAFGP